MDLKQWIWQKIDWPNFTFEASTITPLLRQLYLKLGALTGSSNDDAHDAEHRIDMLLESMLASSAIEGDVISAASLRSSLAKQLNVSLETSATIGDKEVGLAKLVKDVVRGDRLLTKQRLCHWQSFLFSEHPLLYPKLIIGDFRTDETMQVVSGRGSSARVHFEAPSASVLDQEIERFIDWFNESGEDPAVDPIVRAAIAHLWFVTIHPFDDGNGRISRAISDLALRSAHEDIPYVASMSVSILENRSSYYAMLEKTQRGSLNITEWITWFVSMLSAAIERSETKASNTLFKRRFWQKASTLNINDKQRKVMNRLLDGEFTEGLSARHYGAIAKVSKPTATRHLSELVAYGVLLPSNSGGRSRRYYINRKY